MKKIKLGIVVIVALISAQTITAQTVDEVVNKYVDALGGKEKLASLKTVKMEATMNANGADVDITITKSQMVGQRMDIAVMGMNGYQIITPTAGWSFMPFAGQTSPEAMKDEQLKSGISGLDLQGNLFNYKEKGNQLELLGKEKMGDAECYKLKATLKSGKIITYFIDTKTNYIVKSVSTQNINGDEKEVENGYSNYKATSNGFIFPFTGTTMQGEMNFTKIEANIPVDEKIFTAN
jgi:hypothetical protein